MKALFVAAVRFLKVSGSLGRGIRLWDDVFLTNDPARIARLLTLPFKASVGGLEVDNLANCSAAVYQVDDVGEPLHPDSSAMPYLDRLIATTSFFLTCLWLVKDNSANVDTGFLEYPHGSIAAFVSSNSRASYWSNAQGDFTEANCSADELRTARTYFNEFERSGSGAATPASELHDAKVTSRLARAFYFLQAARTTSDLGGKVAHYVTCFEALFSSDATELAHKLAERTALYLGGSTTERIATYRAMKSAYEIRSKTVHGDYLSAKALRNLADASKTADDLLRRVLTKALSSDHDRALFRGPAKDLEEYMLELVLSNRETSSELPAP